MVSRIRTLMGKLQRLNSKTVCVLAYFRERYVNPYWGEAATFEFLFYLDKLLKEGTVTVSTDLKLKLDNNRILIQTKDGEISLREFLRENPYTTDYYTLERIDMFLDLPQETQEKVMRKYLQFKRILDKLNEKINQLYRELTSYTEEYFEKEASHEV